MGNESMIDFSKLKSIVEVDGVSYRYSDIGLLEQHGMGNISRLPYTIKILLESALRQFDGEYITEEHIAALANWGRSGEGSNEVPFKPARIVFQDFTGIPAIVDLTSMRNAVEKSGGNAGLVNPQIPVDLVIDHSVIIEHAGTKEAFAGNLSLEYERNIERYRFVKWAQKSFENFHVVPPSNGIVHQVNLEYLASAVITKEKDGVLEVFPDSLVGTDSHTPMINGIGTVGWGVGGIEAEAAMLGQPLYFVVPEVLGVKLKGVLKEGVTATDLALSITSILRKKGVVGKFVEFFGAGLKTINLTDRATIANMAPEYGATMSFFPTDAVTMDYFRLTGREKVVPLAETYFKAQGLFLSDDVAEPFFTETLEINLSQVVPTMAGPKRPQDSIALDEMKEAFTRIIAEGSYNLTPEAQGKKVTLPSGEIIGAGSIVLAAITSCTNTSNPSVMVAAGLLAKKAVEKGLMTPSYVKTSLTPGSRVVTKYLEMAGLIEPFEQLGFFVDGYGCGACCGNSGALMEAVEKAVIENDLLVAAVLSGNRNFEGRVHRHAKVNYLGSPPLVVVFALAGRVDIDFTNEPIGTGKDGTSVFLKDIWPTTGEMDEVITSHITASLFEEEYASIYENDAWSAIESPEGLLYEWDSGSSYIQEAPYFTGNNQQVSLVGNTRDLVPLVLLGDSITTDHISPAGHIPLDSPAGHYLSENGVKVREFNNYGARRGNHHVMVRGTFANIRLRNQLADGAVGGYTKYLPTGEVMSIFEASELYKKDGRNLLVIAGKEYGTGSSRDWAAKGTSLLGVKVVLAESFERIHRGNLVGMGVLPIQFADGYSAEKCGLRGLETYTVNGLGDTVNPKQCVEITAVKPNGEEIMFPAIIRLDNPIEIVYYLQGGILPAVAEKIVTGNSV